MDLGWGWGYAFGRKKGERIGGCFKVMGGCGMVGEGWERKGVVRRRGLGLRR